MSKAVIVGGGITGLAAAFRLQTIAPNIEVTLVEASDRWGGKIGTTCRDGFVIESGPDCFLSRKPRGTGLCEELGIADQLVGRDPDHAHTFVLRHGALHPLPAGLTGMIPTNLEALTQSTLLSAAGSARVAQETALSPEPAGEDESVASFITRRLGREAFENLVEPLMGGIYAGQASRLSLAATFPQLRQLELEHGSLLKGLLHRPPGAASSYPPFASFPGGMQTLVDALVARLQGVTLLLNTSVSRIAHSTEGYELDFGSGGNACAGSHRQADAVILTTPAFVSAPLVRELDGALAQALAEIPYASSALVNLVFNENEVPDLNGYGYVIPLAEARQALACTWTSRKWRDRAPRGQVLLRVYIGRYGQDDVTGYDDDRLLAIARDELRETLGISVTSASHHIFRYPQGIPQYNLGHLERVTGIRDHLASHPGLFMAGAMFNGVGIPDCMASGEAAAEAVLDRCVKSRAV